MLLARGPESSLHEFLDIVNGGLEFLLRSLHAGQHLLDGVRVAHDFLLTPTADPHLFPDDAEFHHRFAPLYLALVHGLSDIMGLEPVVLAQHFPCADEVGPDRLPTHGRCILFHSSLRLRDWDSLAVR